MSKSPKVYLSGYLDVPIERLDEVHEALADHIALTRSEPGCLSFDVTENKAVSGRFDVAEVFEDQAAFDAHQARTKSSPWFEVTKGMPRDYEISLGKPVERN